MGKNGIAFLGLLLVVAACKPAARPIGVLAGADAGVEITYGIAAGASVEVPPGALPPGATILVVASGILLPPDLVAAGPALRIEFSAPLAAGMRATVRIPYDPCRLRAQGGTDADLVLVRRGASDTTVHAPPETTAGSGIVTFELAGTAVLQAAVAEGLAPAAPPYAALSREGYALRGDGTILRWDALSPLPSPFPGIDRAVSVEAGDGLAFALLAEGSVLAWDSAGVPAPVAGLACITRISVGPGGRTLLALALDGTLHAWGRNLDGQAGLGSTDELAVAVPLANLGFARDFAVTRHALVAREDGTVVAMGANDRGQLGQGNLQSSSVPREVEGIEGAVAVAAGEGFSLVLDDLGRVWSFGANDRGQLGDGTFLDRLRPVVVPGLPFIVAIRASTRTSLALAADGRLISWGAGDLGALGTGDFRRSSPMPVPVLTPPGAVVVDLDGGIDGFVVALEDGSLLAFGANGSGALGDGSFANQPLPVRVALPAR